MAILSPTQAMERVKVPRYLPQIVEARHHELRIQMHSQPILNRTQFTKAHTEFLNWVDTILTDKDKQTRFRQLFTLPLATADLCESIMLEFPRALQAYNRFIKNTFTSEDLEQDFRAYLETIGFDDFWQEEGLDIVRKYINSFIVCDMPANQGTLLRPEPYFYLLHLQDVHDVWVNPKSKAVEYIIFYQAVSMDEATAGIMAKLAYFDDNWIRMYIKKKDTGSDWVQLSEVRHNLDYCPVHKAWDEIISLDNPINSKAPFTTTLGDLDDLLFWRIAVKYYQTYGVFPIYWGYKAKCNYRDELTGNECSDGKIMVDAQDFTQVGFNAPRQISTQAPKFKDCPRCAAKKIVGPGTFVEVEPPGMKDEADLRDPVGYVGVDVPALEFVEKKLHTAEQRIVYHTTGKMPSEATARAAINIAQVKSEGESRQNTLRAQTKNYECVQSWLYATLARMRYGQRFVSNTTDLGNQYFLQSTKELNEDYTDTKTAGRPGWELEGKRDFIVLTTYHNNPEQLNRIRIMAQLEPYPDYTLAELWAAQIHLIDKTGYVLKSNFTSFIKRFERENLPITQFGIALTDDKRVETILQTLKKYADEYANFPDPTTAKPSGPPSKP